MNVQGKKDENPSSEDEREEREDKIEKMCDQILQKSSNQVVTITQKQKWDILKLRMQKKSFSNVKMKTLEELTNPIMDKEVQLFKKFTPNIIKLQRFIRMRFLSKIYKSKLKKARYRLNVIKELHNTEETYVNDLQSLSELVLQKIVESLKQNPIKDNQAKILTDMVQCLEKILNTNTNILMVFKIRMVSLQYNFAFFKDFDSCFIPQFQSYFNYCQKFQSFADTIKQVKSYSPQIADIISKAEKDPKFRGLDLFSILVKPIQRLPKYILLLKDLQKHTDDSHIDFQFTKQSLLRFESINEENNSKMDKYIHMCKLKELDKLIAQNQEKKIQIIKQDREFVMEESLNILVNSSDQSVIVYFLSDLILLTERSGSQNQLLQFIEIDEQSICKNVSDQKYFSYLFSIKGKNNSVTFICPTKENKKIVLTQVQTYLKDIRKHFYEKFYIQHPRQQSEAGLISRLVECASVPVIVSTLGTEIKQISDLYTIYIVEISVERIVKRIYVRHSEIRDIRRIAKDEFGLTALPKMNCSYFGNNLKTKLVEQRKMIIEELLQVVLNNSTIQERGEIILKHLGLPTDIFKSLQGRTQSEIFNVKKDRISKLQEVQDESPKSRLSIKLTNKFTRQGTSVVFLLQAQQQIEKNNQKTLKSEQSIAYQGSSISRVPILLTDGSVLEMEISEMTTGSQCTLSLKYSKIQLNHTLDFRLYVMDKNEILKSLDNDELIQKLLQEMVKSGYEKKKVILYFRKYIYLLDKFEQEDFNQEPVRLRLIVFQILDDIHNFKYNLPFMQYCLMTSISIYLRNPYLFPFTDPSKLTLDRIQLLIPSKIFKAHKQNIWTTNIMKCFELLNQEIKLYIDEEKKENPKNIVEDLVRSILYVVVMQRIRQHPLYGFCLYEVEVYKQTLKDVKAIHNQTFTDIMILGINMNGIGLYTQELYQQKKFEPYDRISDVKVFPLSIVIIFEEDSVNYRLNSDQSFHIDQLIKEFTTLNNLIVEHQNQLGNSDETE